MFHVYNDVGVVIATESTRKKAFSKAKRCVAAGTRYAEVPYRNRGMDLVRRYGEKKVA